jgi:Zn finger protein HypA/HybF involved in hydrogenase expression
MHEEPYTQALLDLALREAGGRRIVEIRLGVGQFSAIVAGAVEVFFRHLSVGTPALGARLVFQTVALELTCTACGRTSGLDGGPDAPVRPALASALSRGCPCGEPTLKITGGLGFDLLGLTVDGEDA